MPALTIDLNFSSSQVMGYYRGQVRSIRARATTGQMVQFPASALQKFILKDGVHGRFRIEFDDQYKFIALELVDPSSG
jgi:hypothetical protein